MKKLTLLLAMGVIYIGYITAQKTEPYFVTVKGEKEVYPVNYTGEKQENITTQSFLQTTISSNVDENLPEIIQTDGKTIFASPNATQIMDLEKEQDLRTIKNNPNVTVKKNEVGFVSEYDVALKEIILPPTVLKLNQENVTVVIKNEGTESISNDVELSFKINDGEWITPEILNLSLEPDEEINYTFNTKALFLDGGYSFVTAHIDFELDMNDLNDYITGRTIIHYPRELPFVEDFNTEEDLELNWTVICRKDEQWQAMRFIWDWLNWDADSDPDLGYTKLGATQINAQRTFFAGPPRGNDYLISNPMIIPEAGTYNISFYILLWPATQSLMIKYGTSPDPDEMDELIDYPELLYMDYSVWTPKYHNFEIDTPGEYYFAFYYYPPSSTWTAMDIDKVKIASGEFVGVPDIRFNSVYGPTMGCGMMESIGATVYNRGTASIQEFTLTYQVDGGDVVTQTFTETIGIKESVTVEFEQKYDFSAVGEYLIHFTAETPNEENIFNNEKDITVVRLAPITEIPFVCDFSNDEDRNYWKPTIENGWGFNVQWGCYFPSKQILNIPLHSSCVNLKPDIYRFSFSYSAGRNGITDDFYVAYGKSGNPASWDPAKEFYNSYTGNGVIIEDEFFMFEITEEGNYAFVFFPVRPDGDLAIFGTTIEIAPEHDFTLKKAEIDLARITPKYHFEGEKTFNVILQNGGQTEDENGNIELFVNNEESVSQEFYFTELDETLNITLKPVFQSVQTGELELLFKASIPSGKVNEWEMYKEVSDSTFAWDYIDTYFFDGVGLDVPGSFGLVYELQKSDVLTSIDVGLLDVSVFGYDYSEVEIGLAVYELYDNLGLGEKLFEVVYLRTNGYNEKALTFSVPETELAPGKYYFEVIQFDGTRMGVAFDVDPHGYFYWKNNNILTKVHNVGYIHIRPNFGKNHYTIIASANNLDWGTVEGSGTFTEDTNATVTAHPNEGYHFVNWTEDGVEVFNEAEYIFKVSENRTLIANFAINTYTITASVVGGNGVIEPENETTVNHGGSQQYSITPNYGYHVEQVLVDNEPIFSVPAIGGTYTFTNVTSDHTIVVSFAINIYTVTLSVNPEIGGNVNGGGEFEHGASATVTATPTTNYEFLYWTTGGNQIVENPYTFTVTTNVTLTANFKQKDKLLVSIDVFPEGAGTFTGSGEYNEGDEVTVTASPKEGYNFVNWTKAGMEMSTSLIYTFTIVENVALVANFEFDEFINRLINDNFVLYPNPFTNEIIISNTDMIKSVQIMNAAGQKVNEAIFNGRSIETEKLGGGVYFVVIESFTESKVVYKMFKK